MSLPLQALSPHALGGAASTKPAEPSVDPKALKAAKDFEAIFLRTLLSSLEKTTSVSGSGRPNTAQSTYGSMVVGAMAEQISGAGGIGLAEVVARSLSAHTGTPVPTGKPLK